MKVDDITFRVNNDDAEETTATKQQPGKIYVTPIILRDTASSHMKFNKFNYIKAKQADGGIKIYPTTTDFR